MKTASVRELRQNFGSLLAWLEDGQEIQITMRRRIVARLVLTIKADIESGVLGLISCDWAAVHAEAERLSARHTAEGGHRSMDILHVATALSTGAREFLSFDRNQARLASAEGLTVKP